MVDPKPTSKNKRVNKWGWINKETFTKDWSGLGHAIITKFQKGHVCKKIKNDSFGSNLGANLEKLSWLGPFDMKDTFSSFCLGPHITLSWALNYLGSLGTHNGNELIILIHIFYMNIFDIQKDHL